MPGRLNLAMREEGVDRQEWRTTKVGRREREREKREHMARRFCGWVGVSHSTGIPDWLGGGYFSLHFPCC